MAQKEPDLTKNDKFYQLTIPTYLHTKDCVYYQFHITNLVKNQKYVKLLRFKELKEYKQRLQNMQIELPPFPKTHFFIKTNSDPILINERKAILQKFFSIIIDDPFTRGTKLIKKFLKSFKNEYRLRKSFSGMKKEKIKKARIKSMNKTNDSITININELKTKK